MDYASLTVIAVAGTLIAASAGLRAFLGPAAVSFVAWMGWIDLGESFAWVGHPVVLGSLATAVFLEVLSDKIPILHHFLDVVHVAAKPVAGALVGVSVAGVDPSITAGLAGLLGGGTVAAVTHVTKAGLRVGTTAASAGAAAPGHSLIEDLVALGFVVLGMVGLAGV